MTHPAIDYLFSLERLGMKFGLANMAMLCEALGHPEQAFRSIVVGGTNGKGSVTAMVETALRAAGHRVARYTSPHLLRLEERFVIDGREVTPPLLASAAERIQRTVESLLASGALEAPPTFFECATAIAFELFRDAGVGIAVLEVGLGGRLDATNIVSPVAAAIVSIDFDHEAQLGNTIESIAREKAGIIKPGIPVVCGELPDEALTVVRAVCAERGATFVSAGDARVSVRVTAGGTRLDLETRDNRFEDVALALEGRHQGANAAVAVRLLEVLGGAGIAVGTDSIRAGLTSPDWPARIERFLVDGCVVVLDAAHNPAGARALAAYLGESMPGGVTLVFGAMRDKKVSRMLEALAPAVRHVICTTAATPRALDAVALAAVASALSLDAEAEPDPHAALARACRRGRPVVVAGSIFLVGPLRARLATHDTLR